MAKVRRQTYTLNMYLKKIQDRDIRDDQDVQRMSGQWNNSMMNELIFSVLNGEYIPPIILGQEASSQIYIIDGLQRSTALMMFRYGNYKITSSLEEPVISYRAKVKDSDGIPKFDGNGDIIWETRTFDLRRKTYDKLPEELKKTFNEYQLDCIIHENYSQEQISRLVRRYNNHKPMNISQRTFTYVDSYARRIREILKRKFFIEADYTKNERKSGALERVILESVMLMFHLDDWKKSSQMGAFINENSSPEEFDILENCIERLENIVTDDLYEVFTAKDSFLIFTLFHRFTKLDFDDEKFAGFLRYFKETTENQDMNEFYGINIKSSSKDKGIIMKKLDKLETLLHEYLGITKEETKPELESESILNFVKKNVVSDVAKEDVEQYGEILDLLMEKSNCSAKLMEPENRPSLVAIIAYSFMDDVDLDDWISDFCSRNDDYISNQKENYLYMKNDLQQFLKLENAA